MAHSFSFAFSNEDSDQDDGGDFEKRENGPCTGYRDPVESLPLATARVLDLSEMVSRSSFTHFHFGSRSMMTK